MTFPFLKNFRRGFATNSSSSHSFVYLKEPNPNHDNPSNTENMDVEFGWNDFRLSTLKEKVMYWLVSRVGNSGWGEENHTVQDYREMYPEATQYLSDAEIKNAQSGYIDHNSDVAHESLEVITNPRVVIYGGNDNDGASGFRVADRTLIDFDITPETWVDTEDPYGW